jgi:hypothetical protein
MIARRTFIKGASMAAITATTSGIHVGQSHAQQVPNSQANGPFNRRQPLCCHVARLGRCIDAHGQYRPSSRRMRVGAARPNSHPCAKRIFVIAITSRVEPGPRKPITRTLACCARAASGHAAAPPSSVMKSRR